MLRIVKRGQQRGLLVIARDQGPGIADTDRAMEDGYSTSRGLGRVDKLNPNSDAGKQHEGGEALDQLVVAGGDTA